MIKGDYKKVLWQIFDVLGFNEEEKQYASEKFKKRFAADLLKPLQAKLSKEHNDWINQNMANTAIDPAKAVEIQTAIRSAFSQEEIDKHSHEVFKAILVRYSTSLIQKVDQEKSSKISKIADSF